MSKKQLIVPDFPTPLGRQVWDAFSKKPRGKTKSSVVMLRASGFTYKEISKKLKITIKKAQDLYRRGLDDIEEICREAYNLTDEVKIVRTAKKIQWEVPCLDGERYGACFSFDDSSVAYGLVMVAEHARNTLDALAQETA